MKYTPFEEKKEQFDNTLALYFANRVLTDLKETDAYKQGIVDGVGNVLKTDEQQEPWAFTPFDKLILALKQHFGDENLKSLVQSFKGIGETDPLRIMNSTEKTDLPKIRKASGLIVSALEGILYLPSDAKYKEEYLGDSDKTFNTRASIAFTQASFLLYALLNDKTPGKTDFDFNVVPSTELTFNITASKDYGAVFRPLKEADLLDEKKLTSKGIRMLVQIAQLAVEGGILCLERTRVENMSAIWQKLSKSR